MAEPQTPHPETPNPPAQADKARSPAAAAAEAASALKGEARSFVENGARAHHEATDAVRDLSQTAAEASRAASAHSREVARDVAGNWRDIAQSMLAMQMDFNRWFDDLWRHSADFGLFPALRPARPFAAFGVGPAFGQPPVDLRETQGAYKLCVELPGLKREDVDLEIQGETLALSGHKAEEKEDAGAAYRVSERRFGRFERRFPLPPGIDRGRIEASFRDGVLSVTLPKTGEAVQAAEKVQIRG